MQDAMEAVLIGYANARRGRHPRSLDIRNQAAFCDYLQGVIRSLYTESQLYVRIPGVVGQ
jgi:hypothetical protein